MRLAVVSQGARPVPTDRNPVNKTNEVQTAAIAPHGTTTRWSYTVPVGKKAQIQTASCICVRVTVAAPVGETSAQLAYTPSGGAAVTLFEAHLDTNAALDVSVQNESQLGDMLAGDIITAQDFDTSTGGTVKFRESAKVYEFDA